MNDDQLDRLVSAATVSDTALEQLDLTDGEADLLEAILMDNNATNPIVQCKRCVIGQRFR